MKFNVLDGEVSVHHAHLVFETTSHASEHVRDVRGNSTDSGQSLSLAHPALNPNLPASGNHLDGKIGVVKVANKLAALALHHHPAGLNPALDCKIAKTVSVSIYFMLFLHHLTNEMLTPLGDINNLFIMKKLHIPKPTADSCKFLLGTNRKLFGKESSSQLRLFPKNWAIFSKVLLQKSRHRSII
jgi:hypothetical protein